MSLSYAIWTSALEPELLHALLKRGGIDRDGEGWRAPDGRRTIAVGDALVWALNGLRREPIAGAGGDKHPERFLESPTVKLAAALAALAILALFWIASEQHYQGCVSAAAATTAAPEVEAGANPFNSVDENSGAERSAAVAGCSRLP